MILPGSLFACRRMAPLTTFPRRPACTVPVYGCAEEYPRPNPFTHSAACHNYTSYLHLSWGVATFSLIQNHQSACGTVISIVQICSHTTLMLLSLLDLLMQNKWIFIQFQLGMPNFNPVTIHSKSMFNCFIKMWSCLLRSVV